MYMRYPTPHPPPNTPNPIHRHSPPQCMGSCQLTAIDDRSRQAKKYKAKKLVIIQTNAGVVAAIKSS